MAEVAAEARFSSTAPADWLAPEVLAVLTPAEAVELTSVYRASALTAYAERNQVDASRVFHLYGQSPVPGLMTRAIAVKLQALYPPDPAAQAAFRERRLASLTRKHDREQD